MKNTRRCKVCKQRFEPKYKAMQPVCNEAECITKWHIMNRDKNLKNLQKIDNRERKERLKDVPYYKKKLQDKVQAIARHLDFGKGCISCGKPPLGMIYGGHRWAKGDYSQVRLDLHNISAQCFSCNDRKSGNIDGYLKGLQERYGVEYKEYVQSLPVLYTEIKYNLHEIKLAYAKAVKIESTLKSNLKRYSPEEVIELKNQFNVELGYHQLIFKTK